MIQKIEEVKKTGDTLGGTVMCVLQNVPIGLGEPVFEKLHAQLGKAMLSINAVKGKDAAGDGEIMETEQSPEHKVVVYDNYEKKDAVSDGEIMETENFSAHKALEYENNGQAKYIFIEEKAQDHNLPE